VTWFPSIEYFNATANSVEKGLNDFMNWWRQKEAKTFWKWHCWPCEQGEFEKKNLLL